MIVLDASVIFKWFTNELQTKEAVRLLELHRQGQETIAVPDLLPYEIGNIFTWKKAVPKEMVLQAMAELFSMGLTILPFELEDHLKTTELAREHQISVYDAAYIQLAQKLSSDLITADEKLYQKTKALPFVRLLQ